MVHGKLAGDNMQIRQIRLTITQGAKRRAKLVVTKGNADISLWKRYRNLLLIPNEYNVEMRENANSIRIAEFSEATCNGNNVNGRTRAARVTTCQTCQTSNHRSRRQGGWHVLALAAGRLHSSEHRGRSRHSNQTPGCRPSSLGLQILAVLHLRRDFGKGGRGSQRSTHCEGT